MATGARRGTPAQVTAEAQLGQVSVFLSKHCVSTAHDSGIPSWRTGVMAEFKYTPCLFGNPHTTFYLAHGTVHIFCVELNILCNVRG